MTAPKSSLTCTGGLAYLPAMPSIQGLILVHFSAQPQPFWSVSRVVSSL
jgi:hypothetical protein